MTRLNCNNNQLTSLNIKNGQNTKLTIFNATSNSNLTCIQADATTVPSGANWTKDAGASYSTDCSGIVINSINFPDANFRAIVGGSTIDKNNNGVLSDSEIQAVTSLDVSGETISDLTGIEHFTALTILNCFSNQLPSLDVSKNTALTRLECYANQLTSLDVSKNTALTRLNCRANQLTSLDISKNTALTYLSCYTNQLTDLDVSKNTALTRLECHINQLPSLDVSKNTALTRLDCNNNKLSSLDVSNNPALNYLDCDNNRLTNLNVKNGQNTILTEFYASDNSDLTCIQADANSAPQNTGSTIYTWTKDAGASYSTRCLYINDINFPDANFRAIVTGSTIDTTDDDVLSVSEIQAVTSLDVNGSSKTDAQKIADLTGIEHFTALTILNCFSNQLPSLDVSKNTALTRLECYANQLTSLDVSKNTALTRLNCRANQLTSLDISKNTALTYLSCYTNQLTDLDVSKNTALTRLECHINQLPSLDVSKNTALTRLDCNNNKLSSLDVSNNPALNYLDCDNNRLTNLNVKNGQNTILTEFYASDNSDLTCIQADANSAPQNTGSTIYTWTKDAGASYSTRCLYINDINFPDANFRAIVTGSTIDTTDDDVLSDSEIQAVASLNVNGSSISDLTGIEYFTALTYLNCQNNKLTSLDISKNTALTTLWCDTNKLPSLDVSNNTALTRLYCYRNQLTSLDVSKNTALKELRCNNNQLPSLDVSKNTALTILYCNDNQLTSLDVSKNTALTVLFCRSNQLTSLNVKNGRNNIMETLFASLNPNLTCIQTDTGVVPPGVTWIKDAGASYSTDCNVYWNGTTDTDWATASNWDGGAVPTISDNVVIRKTSNDPVISSSTTASVSGITINSDASLTIDGTLTVNNNATYIRNLTTTNWYLVSSPVTGETYDDDYVTTYNIATNNDNRGIATYNTSSDTWSYMQGGGSGAFTSGKGYSVKRASAGDISFTGTLNTGDVSIAIDNTGNGFNLIGNPYATHINSGTFLTNNTAKLVTETIWVWDQEDEVYDARVFIMDFKLAPTQGFFVQVTSATTGDLTFDYSAIKSTGGTFQKTDLSQIKLSITDGTSKRQARVLYYDAATKGFDNGGDGEAFGGGVPSKFDIYTHLLKDDKGKKYQVQSLPKTDIGSMIIPVGVKADAGKEITFSIEKLNIPSSVDVVLEDRTKGTFTRLDNGNNYKVTLESASDDIGRFYLHTTQSALNILDNKTLSEVSVYKTDNSRLRVVGLPIGDATD